MLFGQLTLLLLQLDYGYRRFVVPSEPQPLLSISCDVDILQRSDELESLGVLQRAFGYARCQHSISVQAQQRNCSDVGDWDGREYLCLRLVWIFVLDDHRFVGEGDLRRYLLLFEESLKAEVVHTADVPFVGTDPRLQLPLLELVAGEAASTDGDVEHPRFVASFEQQA